MYLHVMPRSDLAAVSRMFEAQNVAFLQPHSQCSTIPLYWRPDVWPFTPSLCPDDSAVRISCDFVVWGVDRWPTLNYIGYMAIIDCRVHSEVITRCLRSYLFFIWVVFAEINKDCPIVGCIWVRRQKYSNKSVISRDTILILIDTANHSNLRPVFVSLCFCIQQSLICIVYHIKYLCIQINIC